MRFLGPASRLLKNVRPQTKHFTPVHYRTFAQYLNSMPSSPIMADSSLSKTRVLSESEADEPAHKKPRLDDRGKEANIQVDSAMEDPIASTSQQTTKTNGLEKRLKKKNKKRKEIPLPELCSAADVLYQEIRSILGGDVVDGVTREGGAFKSPYSRGDEVEVTIDRMTAGGKFKVLGFRLYGRAWNLTYMYVLKVLELVWFRRIKDHGPLSYHLLFLERRPGFASERMIECTQLVKYSSCSRIIQTFETILE